MFDRDGQKKPLFLKKKKKNQQNNSFTPPAPATTALTSPSFKFPTKETINNSLSLRDHHCHQR
jgi:hypothetical protein